MANILAILLFALTAKSSDFRIVSLHPALTENIFALGLGQYIVGTTEYSDYPQAAKDIPRVGDNRFNSEKIISLKPTHIVSIVDNYGIPQRVAEKLGVKTLHLPLENLEDFEPTIKKLGETFKVDPHQLLEKWNYDWNAWTPKVSSIKGVLIQIQIQPLVGAGQKTFLNELLKKCGARNVLENLNGYPALNRETLVKLKPDIVMLLLTDADDRTKKANENTWRSLSKKSELIYFDPDTISKISPRLPAEAQKFCGKLL